jgi:FkbM family methyltransferase
MRWLRNIRRKKEERPFHIATEADIYYCYRLLLRRPPDEKGLQDWVKEVNSQTIALERLVEGFMTSEEYRQLQVEANRPYLVERADFKIYVRLNDYATGMAIASGQDYEPHVSAALRQLLEPGMTFVDVGANIGYFALLAASLAGPQGKVIAFEPNLENCDLFRRSIAANGFDGFVEIHPYAAAEKAQTFVLDVGGSSSNGRIIDFTPQAVPGINPPRVVEAVALDDHLADEARIDVVKMDIEGAEPRAFQGMRQVMQQHRPILLLEFCPFLIEVTSHLSPAAFLEELVALDYELAIVARDDQPGGGRQDPATILEIANRPGQNHVDLLAYPKEANKLAQKAMEGHNNNEPAQQEYAG